MRCALLGLALIACATTHTDKLDVQGEREGVAQGAARGVTHEEPSVVMEFGAPEKATAPEGAVGPPRGPSLTVPATSPNSLPPHGPLRKLTITGAKWAEYGSEYVAQTEAHASAEGTHTSTATPKLPTIPLSCGLAGGVWIYVAVAVALGGGVSAPRIWAWLKAIRERMTRS